MTSAARSSVGFLKLQTQSSHVERLKSSHFFTLAKITGRSRRVRVPCYHHHHHPNYHFSNGGRGVTTRFVVNSTSATTTQPSSAAGALSEVEKIKLKCLKWQWKGQYSINYFVSSDVDSSQQHPPLLLVHGFGASIPHWRR